MVDGKQYYEITGCSSVGGFRVPEFSIEEVQQYLIDRGYSIVIHEAVATVHFTESDGCEVRRTGQTEECLRKRILAVKPGTELPKRVDSDEAVAMDFRTVFNKEIRNKLLNI